MRSTFSRMAVVALTVWFGLAAGAANAVPVLLTFNGWDSTIPGVATTSFDSGSVNLSTFDGWLNFSLPANSTGHGSASTSAVSAFGDGTISQFQLWEDSSTFVHLAEIAHGVSGSFSSLLHFSAETVPGYYSLYLQGSGANRYTGSIATPVAIPEPEIYAMMAVGLGLLGFSARRRMNNNA